jgi:hypothetical protein
MNKIIVQMQAADASARLLEMRAWLRQRDIVPAVFSYGPTAGMLHVEIESRNEAIAFAEWFAGRLISS